MKITLSSSLIPHIRRGRFYNHPLDVPESMVLHTIPTFMKSVVHRAFRSRPEMSRDWVLPASIPDIAHDPLIVWLGHSTFLIQLNGVTILTDPIFGNLSPFFPRLLSLPCAPEQLPAIDVVLLSHNHPDHTNVTSLKRLTPDKKRWYGVCQGDGSWLASKITGTFQEFSWWEQMTITTDAGEIVVTFLPAHHWSARSFFDRNRSLWGSWMIQGGGKTIYFGGDTAYWDHFAAIAQHFKTIDVALLPIGPCEPSNVILRTHMSPEQATQAFIDLRANHFIPMHWGTYPFGRDHFDLPITRLTKSWQEKEIHTNRLSIVKAGQLFPL